MGAWNFSSFNHIFPSLAVSPRGEGRGFPRGILNRRATQKTLECARIVSTEWLMRENPAGNAILEKFLSPSEKIARYGLFANVLPWKSRTGQGLEGRTDVANLPSCQRLLVIHPASGLPCHFVRCLKSSSRLGSYSQAILVSLTFGS